ncbi:MAG: hypothetical protein FWG87_14845 [Defluviitaleaceae bacterium]|nr:hypothetical protein [Defluviitaleaceae bacterium]
MEENKYLVGSVRVKGITPTDDFLEFAEKERLGIATEEDYASISPRGYTVGIPNEKGIKYDLGAI